MLIPTTIFESMGFTYLGPVDGHDTENLISLLRIARDMEKPVVLHVMTQKGRGYAPAQEHPKLFHGIGRFNPITGEPEKKSCDSFSDAFGSALVELAGEDARVCAITAAMPGGTGLLDYVRKYPKRMFDVGIAEEHAVSMAGGLAKQGMIPVVAIYSTFLQRAYDQILQDVCMLGLHVVFAVDRAGLVGDDGETHQGIYDVGFLRHAPGLKLLCPASKAELKDMLRWAVKEQSGPVAIRYPRGDDRTYTDSAWDAQNPVVRHKAGTDATIITYGTLLQNAIDASDELEGCGISAGVLRLMTVNPLPSDEIRRMIAPEKPVIVVEEVSGNCGVHEAIAAALKESVTGVDLGCRFIPHGSVSALYEQYGLSGQAIAKLVQEVCGNEN